MLLLLLLVAVAKTRKYANASELYLNEVQMTAEQLFQEKRRLLYRHIQSKKHSTVELINVSIVHCFFAFGLTCFELTYFYIRRWVSCICGK